MSAYCLLGGKMKKDNIPNKHLTYADRNFIEIGLNNGRNFAEIAKDLNKNRTTIMREVQNRKFRKNRRKNKQIRSKKN